MSVPNKGIINLLINGLEHAEIMMYLLVIENVIKRISYFSCLSSILFNNRSIQSDF